MTLYTIFNEKIQEVQSLIADGANVVEGTSIIAFSTDGEIEMLYNLPAGYSITGEDV